MLLYDIISEHKGASVDLAGHYFTPGIIMVDSLSIQYTQFYEQIILSHFQ